MTATIYDTVCYRICQGRHLAYLSKRRTMPGNILIIGHSGLVCRDHKIRKHLLMVGQGYGITPGDLHVGVPNDLKPTKKNAESFLKKYLDRRWVGAIFYNCDEDKHKASGMVEKVRELFQKGHSKVPVLNVQERMKSKQIAKKIVALMDEAGTI